MPTTAATIARVDVVLEHGDWQPRGLAALELAPPAVVEDHAALIVPPRHDNGRFRSTRSDIAFAIA